MKYLILILLLMTGCSSEPEEENHLDMMIRDARSRDYGTVCDHDSKGKYCVIAYSQKYPEVMVSFDACLKDFRKIRSVKKRMERAEWCACIASDFGADLGVSLYRCGSQGLLEMIKVGE